MVPMVWNGSGGCVLRRGIQDMARYVPRPLHLSPAEDLQRSRIKMIERGDTPGADLCAAPRHAFGGVEINETALESNNNNNEAPYPANVNNDL